VEHLRTGLRLVSQIDHQAGKLKDGEIESDRPGRGASSAGGGRHGLSQHESSHEHDAQTFARELAEVLRVARNEHRFERLVLVAEPHFLGILRGALDSATSALVHDTVGKDLAHVPLRDLADHLRDVSFL